MPDVTLPEPNLVVIARQGRNILAFVLRDVPEGDALDTATKECIKRNIEYKTCYRCNELLVVGS